MERVAVASFHFGVEPHEHTRDARAGTAVMHMLRAAGRGHLR
jgi:hypothetical protein